MRILIVLFFSIAFFSCQNAETPGKADSDTLKQSDVFNGVYSGLTPCADCPGINIQVNFSPDSMFYETLEYLERNTTFSDTGRWKKSDSIITVEFPDKPDYHQVQFKVMNDSIIKMLDGSGNVITGPLAENYNLKKSDTLPSR